MKDLNQIREYFGTDIFEDGRAERWMKIWNEVPEGKSRFWESEDIYFILRKGETRTAEAAFWARRESQSFGRDEDGESTLDVYKRRELTSILFRTGEFEPEWMTEEIEALNFRRFLETTQQNPIEDQLDILDAVELAESRIVDEGDNLWRMIGLYKTFCLDRIKSVRISRLYEDPEDGFNVEEAQSIELQLWDVKNGRVEQTSSYASAYDEIRESIVRQVKESGRKFQFRNMKNVSIKY